VFSAAIGVIFGYFPRAVPRSSIRSSIAPQ
jgi:hypothetical protein